MRVLVTGGAGYIGSHIVRLLARRGDDVVIVDDLSAGRIARVPNVPLVELDLAMVGANDVLASTISEHKIDAVIHLAARKQVGESVERPVWYYQQNIGSLTAVLDAMRKTNVKKLIFSSSAAVYGASEGAAISEEAATVPINPYGETKLVGEWLVNSSVQPLGLRAASLRYFNVAGAGWPELGDTEAFNLVPMVFERLERSLQPLIFGGDYPTKDGTCVRDFIHVLDVAEAHLATLDYLGRQDVGHAAFNLGTGNGASVREVVDLIASTAGVEVFPEIRSRREGDAAFVVASRSRAALEIGWRARLGLDDIIVSAWDSRRLTAQN